MAYLCVRSYAYFYVVCSHQSIIICSLVPDHTNKTKNEIFSPALVGWQDARACLVTCGPTWQYGSVGVWGWPSGGVHKRRRVQNEEEE